MTTITEALAEIKTIEKRITSKQEFVRNYMIRVETLKDPFEKDGGSEKAVNAELQALADLEERLVTLRLAIQTANEKTDVTVNGETRSIADWLVWRRDVAPTRERFLFELRSRLSAAREGVRRQNVNYIGNSQPDKPIDIVVNLNETALNRDLEQIKDILGQLDGQLSVKNATVTVKI